MIKYLSNEEKNLTRPIWEKIFLEDSKKFLDYYYNIKTKNNQILVRYKDEKIVSMLHLNPYNVYIAKNISPTYYVVAVATLEEHRKKGYMSELLKQSLKDCYENEIPFIFLRPAKEEIYLPFGFRYIYNHKFLDLIENKNLIEKPITKDDYKYIADFTNDFLSKKYTVFCFRDNDYIQTLHKEVISEGGDIIKLYEDDVFLGYYVYWGIEEKIIRAIFMPDAYTKIEKEKPLVMARIVNIYSFFKNFSLKQNSQDICIYLNIKDNILKENNGLFKLTISYEKSSLEKIQSTDKSVLTLDISDLTSLFFGYKDISCFTDNKTYIDYFSKINLLDKIFIDEEV